MKKYLSLEELKENLSALKKLMANCVSEQGYVFNGRKYDYNNYIREAADVKSQIDKIEKKYKNIINYR